MTELMSSRRSFVAAVAVGTAAAGSLALLGRQGVAPEVDGRIRVVPGAAAPAFHPVAHEAQQWTAAIGRPIRIGAEGGGVSGVVDSVVPLARGNRPAGMRDPPFLVRLAVDAAGAPAGDRIYALSTPIAGLSDVFLTRGADVAGKAILLAVFG